MKFASKHRRAHLARYKLELCGIHHRMCVCVFRFQRIVPILMTVSKPHNLVIYNHNLHELPILALC